MAEFGIFLVQSSSFSCCCVVHPPPNHPKPTPPSVVGGWNTVCPRPSVHTHERMDDIHVVDEYSLTPACFCFVHLIVYSIVKSVVRVQYI